MSPPDPDARPSAAGAAASDGGDPGVSRRSLLAGAGAALAGAASTAGCIELLPPLGQEVRYEDVDMPDAAPPRYRDWVPDTEASDDIDLSLGTVAIPNNDAREVFGAPLDTGTAFIAPTVDYFGVGIRNFDLAFVLYGPPSVVVLEGPVEPSEVGPVLRDSGYEAVGPRRGFERYVREDLPRTVAVSEGRILFGQGHDRDEAIELALDTAAGDVPAATQQAGFERISDAIGLRPFVWIYETVSDQFEEYRVDRYGTALDYDESSMYAAFYFVFDGPTPSREEIRAEAIPSEFDLDAAAIETVVDGEFRGVEARLDSGAVKSDLEEVGPIPPQITWGVERSGDAITLRHDAGDAVPADRLVVAVGYRDGGPVEADVQFTDRYETVGRGTTLAVPRDAIPRDEDLAVWYIDESTQMSLVDVSP